MNIKLKTIFSRRQTIIYGKFESPKLTNSPKAAAAVYEETRFIWPELSHQGLVLSEQLVPKQYRIYLTLNFWTEIESAKKDEF